MDASFIPLGICQLAAGVRLDQVEVDLLDFRFVRDWREVEQKLAASRADVAAISFQTPNRDNAVKVAALARKHGCRTVAGGPHATALPEDLVASGVFDHVVVGEGEEVFRALLAGRYPASAPQVISGHVVDLNALPFPYFFPLYVEKIMKPRGILPLMITRCCPGRCTFCYPLEKKLFGNTKFRRADNVFAEILAWQRVFPVKELWIYDNMFVANRQLLHDFHALRKQHGLQFTFNANARADYLTEELVALLADSGCIQLNLGVESGSQRILDQLGKGIRVEQYLRVAEWCHRHGVWIAANLLAGVPGETEHDLRLTYRLLRRMRPNSRAFNYLVPFPGTLFYEQARQEKIIRLDLPFSAYEMNLNKLTPLLTGMNLRRLRKWEGKTLRLVNRQQQFRMIWERVRAVWQKIRRRGREKISV